MPIPAQYLGPNLFHINKYGYLKPLSEGAYYFHCLNGDQFFIGNGDTIKIVDKSAMPI